jgi:N utilization substance protein A
LGRGTGILPREEQIAGEYYRLGQRFRVYIVEVQKGPQGSVVLLSRVRPEMISRLFEIEVPEISAGTVEITSVAREAGSRSKIAVMSTEEKIDPIGSLVGQKGTRVQAVINELGGEKIDIIQWDESPAKFVGNSLSPAKVVDVEINEEEKRATVKVPEDQLSLAIGKRGQNVRLAAKLTGWRIDILSAKGEVVDVEETEEKEAEKAAVKEEEKETEKKEEIKEKEPAGEEKGGETKKEEEKPAEGPLRQSDSEASEASPKKGGPKKKGRKKKE